MLDVMNSVTLETGYRWRETSAFGVRCQQYTELMIDFAPAGERDLAALRLVPTFLENMPDSEFPLTCERLKELGGWGSAYDAVKERPALYLLLARLSTDRESIVKFANKHGSLWNMNSFTSPPNFDGYPSVLDWRIAATAVRSAVELWRGISDRDERLLERHVRWTKKRLEFPSWFCPTGEWESLFRRNWQSRIEGYRRGDLAGPAKDLLRIVIDSNLRNTAEAGVWFGTNGISLSLKVDGVLGACWFQIATAVSEDRHYRDCEHCGAPFELSPGVNRADKTFCSDSCRVSAYRRRRARAEELHAAGRPLKAIIKEVGTDAETVKRWLANGKNGKH